MISGLNIFHDHMIIRARLIRLFICARRIWRGESRFESLSDVERLAQILRLDPDERADSEAHTGVDLAHGEVEGR